MPIERLVKIEGNGQDLVKKVLENNVVTFNTELSQPPSVIEMSNGMSHVPLLTLGNFSSIIGKAKGRKSFFSLMIIAAALSGKYESLDSVRNSIKPKIVLFDTEQSKYHLQLNCNRIIHMLKLEEHHPDLIIYELRPYNTVERTKIIHDILYSRDDINLIVIDGIRDLISDINNPDQATDITCNLLKWSEEKNIHIVNVIHQNKTDNNARGHLGSELINKSETVLSINLYDHDKKYSIVTPEYVRTEDFEPFLFEVTFDECLWKRVPILVDQKPTNRTENGQQKKKRPEEIEQRTHESALVEMHIDPTNGFGSNEVISMIRKIYDQYSIVEYMGINQARNFLKYYVEEDLIIKKAHKYFPKHIPF